MSPVRPGMIVFLWNTQWLSLLVVIPPVIQHNSFHSSDCVSGAVSDQDVTGSMPEEELKVCVNTMLFCIRHSWLLIHRRWRGPGGVSLGTMGTARTAPRLRKALVYVYGFIIKDKIGVHLGEKDAQSRVWGRVGSLIPSSGISLYQHLLMFPD